MPPLKRPENLLKITLPPRSAHVAAETDVLVVGGGPAGLGAAWGAAKAGAKVILVERYGFLGGNATAALVMPIMSFYTDKRPRNEEKVPVFRTDHGSTGDPVIAGFLKFFLDRLIHERGALQPSSKTGYTMPFDAEIFKLVALQTLDEVGVEFLFHAFASHTIMDDRIVQGAVFETKSGPLIIRAHAVVDATGDGDIAAGAGAPYEIGREDDGLVQPMTLMFRVGDFDRTAFEHYVKMHPGQWRGIHGLWNLIEKAQKCGELELPREDILFFSTLHERELAINSTRVTGVLGTDVWDWSYAEWKGRFQMWQIMAFFKKYVPGFKDAILLQSGVHTGVRETRRIRGEYQLTEADVLGARKFSDVIARNAYPIDIHNPEGKGTLLKKLPPGTSYDIPLRTLLPLEVENLIVAGRCISGTYEAHSSYRIMPVSMATGQAAGVCAAFSAKQKKDLRKLSVEDVQAELIKQGASLR